MSEVRGQGPEMQAFLKMCVLITSVHLKHLADHGESIPDVHGIGLIDLDVHNVHLHGEPGGCKYPWVISHDFPDAERNRKKPVLYSRIASDGVLGAAAVICPPVEMQLEHPVVCFQGTPGTVDVSFMDPWLNGC